MYACVDLCELVGLLLSRWTVSVLTYRYDNWAKAIVNVTHVFKQASQNC